jgi:hypothetical protein
MSGELIIRRGCVFAAEHDPSYGPAWVSDSSAWKKCLAFNLGPPVQSDSENVHYFLATSETWRFTENPQLLSEVHIFAAGSYPFFPKETAIEFSELWIQPLSKLKQHRVKIQGYLSPSDLQLCIETASTARLLLPRHKRLVGLLPQLPTGKSSGA